MTPEDTALADRPVAPSPFSPTLPTMQVVWDSTSLGWIKTCPRLYQYQMILQFEPRLRSVHLTFGSLYASGLEHYAHARANGQSHDEATLTMCLWALENSGERTPDGEWLAWDPGDHPDANLKNRYTLLRSLIWNVEDRETRNVHTLILSNGRPAVELSFNFAFTNIEGHDISLSGHLDQIEVIDGQNWIVDDKTSKSALSAQYFSQYSPNNQMSLYMLAGQIILGDKIAGIKVNAAQIGVNFTRFASRMVPRSQPVLDEWMHDAQYWIRQALGFAQANYWPMNDKACGNYGGCPFKSVCTVSPSHRTSWLKADFVHKVWNPCDTRGDI